MIAPWAKEEMTTADLGDDRLDARAVMLLSALGSRPSLSIPAACRGRAEMKAAYRFFDNDKVTFAKVLQPHIERTRERMAEQPVVLLVQDTSEIDLTRPEQEVKGVGDLDGSRRGVLLHAMQAFTPEGAPLGTVWAEILNRTGGVSHASSGGMDSADDAADPDARAGADDRGVLLCEVERGGSLPRPQIGLPHRTAAL